VVQNTQRLLKNRRRIKIITALLAKLWNQIGDEKRIDTVLYRTQQCTGTVPVVDRKENLENVRDSVKAIE
jgi:hypothetical protein